MCGFSRKLFNCSFARCSLKVTCLFEKNKQTNEQRNSFLAHINSLQLHLFHISHN